jgi:hypothetical protein
MQQIRGILEAAAANGEREEAHPCNGATHYVSVSVKKKPPEKSGGFKTRNTRRYAWDD